MMCALALISLLAQVGLPAYANLSHDLHQAAAAATWRKHCVAHAAMPCYSSKRYRYKRWRDWGLGWRTHLAHNGQLLHEQRLARRLEIASNVDNEVTFSGLGVPLRGNRGFLGATLEICPRTEQTSRYWVVLAPSGRVDLRTGTRDSSRCAGA